MHDFPNPFKHCVIEARYETSYSHKPRWVRNDHTYKSLGLRKGVNGNHNFGIGTYFQEARYEYRDGVLKRFTRFGHLR